MTKYLTILNMAREISKQQALEIASKYGLEQEIKKEMEDGASPEEALREYDLL